MTAALDCGGMSCLSFAPAVGVTTTKEKHHDKTNSSRVPGRERPGGQRPQSALDRSRRRLATQERCRLRPGHPDRHGRFRPHRLHAAERRQDRELRLATPVRVARPVPADRRTKDPLFDITVGARLPSVPCTNDAGYVQSIDAVAFQEDQLRQDAVMRNFEIIGEAATQMMDRYTVFVEEHPEVPWQAMRGMCNRMAHGYFDTNLEVVWETVQQDLPAQRPADARPLATPAGAAARSGSNVRPGN